ncbi:hypothetical protein ABVV53_10200 [Novosphingobium sp. RD2P27]|uniref:Uncharacterized protein n=1 Tax=Novosphingobium kalidii TaxID=3230299 RepID=A0ABV2D1V3_9SPHN
MDAKLTFAAALAASIVTPAMAAGTPSYKAETPVVVERAPNGRATAVRVDGTVYPVCTTEQQDGCIQPRAAKLGWGDRPLTYWPGERAYAESRGQ